MTKCTYLLVIIFRKQIYLQLIIALVIIVIIMERKSDQEAEHFIVQKVGGFIKDSVAPVVAQTVKDALALITEGDIAHRVFLKPIQIALNNKPGGLARGLSIAIKDSITLNKYKLVQLHGDYEAQLDTYKALKDQNRDNMLSFMKKKAGIKLAICVCMYSETKKMLKSTLAGIAENIDLLVRSGLTPDDIGVFVLMDGIEKVDPSVVQYFQELQKQSGIFLGDSKSYNLKDLANQLKEDTDLDQRRNINDFLFSPIELADRRERRFSSVSKEYMMIRKLKTEIEALQKRKPLFEDLPTRLRPFFLKIAREDWRMEQGATQEEAQNITLERLETEFINDLTKCRMLVVKTLHEGNSYCDEYISTREKLSYLGVFSTNVKLNNEPPQSSQNKRENIYRQNSSVISKTKMNLFMCVKYKNGGKLTSHNWFFNGFCRELKPQVGVLLDVGLRPAEDALYKMYYHILENPTKVGGVCGYMSLKIEKVEEEEQINSEEIDYLSSFAQYFVDIQKAQQSEYHFAHIIDKSFESMFSFIHVLPGAYSAYNMAEIFGWDKANQADDTLLMEYFKSIEDKLANSKIKPSKISAFDAVVRVALPEAIVNWINPVDPESEQQMLYNQNIYLAEDRILCMGIHKKGLDLVFLPDAYAEVDPIKTVHGLFGQRKRWINGSFFAFEKVKVEQAKYEKSNDKYECHMHLQMVYLSLMNTLAYFAPSTFLFTFHIAVKAFRDDVLVNVFGSLLAPGSSFYDSFVYSMDFIYVMLLLYFMFFSLHVNNNHPKFRGSIYLVSTFLGLFAVAVFLVLLVDIVRGFLFGTAFLTNSSDVAIPGGQTTINALRYIIISTLAMYALAILVYLLRFGRLRILFQVLTGTLSFIFYSPTYMNLLPLYSLCRIDDISWGTKGLDASNSKNSNLKDCWKAIKYIYVYKFFLWNVVASAVFLTLGGDYLTRFFFTLVIVVFLSITLAFKMFIAIFYMLVCCPKVRQKPSYNAQVTCSKLITSSMKLSDEIKSQLKTQLLENVNQIAELAGVDYVQGIGLQEISIFKMLGKLGQGNTREIMNKSFIHKLKRGLDKSKSVAEGNKIKRNLPTISQSNQQTFIKQKNKQGQKQVQRQEEQKQVQRQEEQKQVQEPKKTVTAGNKLDHLRRGVAK